MGSLGAPLHGDRAQSLDGAGAALGNLGRRRVRARAPGEPPGGRRRRRARVRHRIRLVLGRSRRLPAGRSRRLAQAARHRGPPAAGVRALRSRSSTRTPRTSRTTRTASISPISEYGASLWCEPHRWLAEADRLLRPGGGLIFVTNSPLLMACTPESGERAGDRLVRDYFRSPVREYPDGVVEFHLTHGSWIGCSRATASPSSGSSSCARRTERSRASTSSRSSGPGAGPARRSGSRASCSSAAGRVRRGRLGSRRAEPRRREPRHAAHEAPRDRAADRAATRVPRALDPARGGARARTGDRGRQGARALLPRVREPDRGGALRRLLGRPARPHDHLRRRAARRRPVGRAHGRVPRPLPRAGGALSPLDGVEPGHLRIDGLIGRVEANGVTEVVLATNPTMTGEATAAYLADRLRGRVEVTRLASGLPVGGDLEYADEVTLGRALAGRRAM